MNNKWLEKFKWQFVSFKFLAFWGIFILLILVWQRLELIYSITIQQTQEMFIKGMLTQDNVATIITQTSGTLFNSTISHLLIFTGTILSGIVAIKGVSDWSTSRNSKEDTSTENVTTTTTDGKKDLKKFLPKGK